MTGISAGWFALVAIRTDGISAVTSVWTLGNTIAAGSGIATQIAAGGASSFAVRTVAYLLGS